MTGWNEAFPYAVADNLWVGPVDDDWPNICKWLDQTLPDEWEYFNGEYRFKTEHAKMLFLLKWGQ